MGGEKYDAKTKDFYSYEYSLSFMDRTQFLERLNSLIEEGRELANTSLPVRNYEPLELDIPHYVKCHSWWLGCLNLIRNFFGSEHHFFTNFKNAAGGWQHVVSNNIKQPIPYPKEDMAKAYAVLFYIKKEFELGLVADARHLYEANLFSNLLDQAFELVEKNYLVGAAVYCRLIIENFINDLCRIKKIELEDKENVSSKLVKLRKKEVFDLPTERMIQGKYDIGTYAVHGKEEFKKYTKEDILDLLQTTRDKILTIR